MGMSLVGGSSPNTSFVAGTQSKLAPLLAIASGAALMLILGAVDDKYDLKARTKILAQIGIAILVGSTGVRITMFVDNLVFSYLVTILWMLTVVNAFNIMDNMNGLCSGLAAIAALAFALSSAILGHYLVASLSLAIAGAYLGFLPHNFPQARSFLGDSGSHLTGYLMAQLAVLPHFYSDDSSTHWAITKPLVILAIPLIDMILVIIIRIRLRQPIWIGDNNHLSHRLVKLGLSQTTAVLVILLLATASATISFLY
jgi:UDP-GlcNAc:undecaprenyl-phosphate GlcNAc-1-phosphate transferase